MPGLTGIFSKRPAIECEAIVRAMTDSMMHEKFYSAGFCSASETGIYTGWVALDDSYAANQPFCDSDGNVTLILSGECFGQRADSLVELYKKHGEKFFAKLNGLFSGLLIDRQEKAAFLFNDRYGVERVYIHEKDDEVYFASEAKALLRVLPELRAFDEDSLAQYLAFGCTLEWRTLFRQIDLLPGGSVWHLGQHGLRKRRYFLPDEWERQEPLSAEHFEAEFEETFKKVLPRYLNSKSKVGVSLTGGLDTRMIMACLPLTAEGATSYTFVGKRGETLDSRIARQVAKICGLDHQLLRIGEDFFTSFRSYSDRTVFISDGSFGIAGAHEIYLNREARQIAKVRLAGAFGSEVLRGMSTFKPIGLSRDLLNPSMRKLIDLQIGRVRNGTTNQITFAAFKEIPWNIFGSPAICRSQLNFRTPYLDNEIVAVAYRAPASLSKSSLPASHLIRRNKLRLNEIPTDMGMLGRSRAICKFLRRIHSRITFKLDYLSNEGLPHWLSVADPLFDKNLLGVQVFGLHKYLRYRRWFRKELGDYLIESLKGLGSLSGGLWNAGFIRRLAEEHRSGRKNFVLEINAVLTIDAIERLLFRLPSSVESFGRLGVAGTVGTTLKV